MSRTLFEVHTCKQIQVEWWNFSFWNLKFRKIDIGIELHIVQLATFQTTAVFTGTS